MSTQRRPNCESTSKAINHGCNQMLSKRTHHSDAMPDLSDNGPLSCWLVRLLVWLSVASSISVSGADAASDFESVIAPLLVRRCVECHQGKNPSGGLLLTTRKGLHAGGESGQIIDLRNIDDSKASHDI